LTKEEFIASWCDASEFPPDHLKNFGLEALPCTCGEANCKGWVMLSPVNQEDHLRAEKMRKGNG
jgi:hypothetical protein